MTATERRALLAPAVQERVAGGAVVWAELGAGDGAFTLVLAALLGGGATVIAVDRDRRALTRLARAAHLAGAAAAIETLAADFRRPLPLPELDGVLLANALHYVRETEQAALLKRLADRLKPDGRLVVVEYDLARPNPWVPYPIPPLRFEALARDAGLRGARVLSEAPSRYWGRAYSAFAVPGKPPRA
ncbi:MAG: class I SAM-dependent methyltransferase [Deinococcales bacterium]